MANPSKLDSYLRSRDLERLEDIIASLETFEDVFRPEHVIPGAIVLLNLLHELPERPLEMFGIGGQLIVKRVVYRLVRTLQNPNQIEDAIRSILPNLRTLYAKEVLISIVGYRKSVGHRLVSEVAAREFEKGWRAEVRSAAAEDLATEKHLLRTLLLVKREADPTEPSLTISDSPAVTLSILQSARREVLSQSLGSRAVQRSLRLDWDGLIELYGSEEILRKRLEELKSAHLGGEDELLHLADKYLSGWRPRDFDED